MFTARCQMQSSLGLQLFETGSHRYTTDVGGGKQPYRRLHTRTLEGLKPVPTDALSVYEQNLFPLSRGVLVSTS